MIDAILSAAKASNSSPSNTGKFMWHQVVLYVSKLFEKRSPTSLNRIITFISPHVPWDGALNNTIAVARWAAAVSTIPYTEEVGSSVVDTLFQISFVDILRPHIPIDIWRLLKRQPSLPSTCHGLTMGGYGNTVAYVRRLGDIDILKSYFLLVWRDRYAPSSDGAHAMERSIRDDFSGVRMEQHRNDLIKRLDHVLEQVDQRLEYSPNDAAYQLVKKRYTNLKGVLMEVDRQ